MTETCRKCGGDMLPGLYTMQTLTPGTPDFPGDRASTLSAGGPGVLSNCMKCVRCGWSVTGPKTDH